MSYFSLVFTSGEALTYDDKLNTDLCGSATGLSDKIFTSVCYDDLTTFLNSNFQFNHAAGAIVVGQTAPSASCTEITLTGSIKGVKYQTPGYSWRKTDMM